MHHAGAALLTLLVALTSTTARAGEVPVADVPGLLAAISAAAPGDIIVLAPGDYEVHQNKISCEAAGTADAPIVVRAAELGTVNIKFDAVEGFHVRGPFWEFANLDIEGICAADSDCEHAFHVTGNAESTWLHNNRMHGFNAMIKGNGEPIGPNDSYVWPDDVVVEYNELYNPAPRDTGNPVTPIDVVGGHRWILRGNFIHDHAKGGGDNISYAAFLKGHSKDGVIERNLVVCELLHTGQTRLGLSLGGGGTGPDSICEDGACKPEHERGTLRNNLVIHCPADVGIYINAGADSQIVHNTLFDTAGIDMRFAQTTGLVANNILDGKVRDRDGAVTTKMNNLEQAAIASWFTDPGNFDFTLVDGAALVDLAAPLPEVKDDYCGNDRDDGKPDIGAIEYDGDGCVGGKPVPSGDTGDTTETTNTTDPTTSDPTTDTADPTNTTNTGTASDPTGAPTTSSATSATDSGDTPTSDSNPTTQGTTDANTTDANTTSGPSESSDSGCACRSAAPTPTPWLLALASLVLPRRRACQRRPSLAKPRT